LVNIRTAGVNHGGSLAPAVAMLIAFDAAT
jgi:hypothetical protein